MTDYTENGSEQSILANLTSSFCKFSFKLGLLLLNHQVFWFSVLSQKSVFTDSADQTLALPTHDLRICKEERIRVRFVVIHILSILNLPSS